MATPISHKEQSLSLNPEQLLELFEIILKNGTIIRSVSGRAREWAGSTYESAYISVSGVSRNSGEQRVRPTLTIGNPLDIFHVPVADGELDGAIVKRYKVRPSQLAADPPVYEQSIWYIAQITGLGEVITAQMRSVSDRQESQLPARQFLKPEFPSVTI